VKNRVLLPTSLLLLAVGSLAVSACGDDDENKAAGAANNNGDGGVGPGQPQQPPRQDPQIAEDHPRIFFSTGNKERLLAKLTAREPAAVRFQEMVDSEIGGREHYAFEQWNAALLGVVTGDAKYCTHAIAKTDEWVKEEETKITANQNADVARDSYLEVGGIIGGMAMVYDWCFAALTPEQRTRWATYGNQAVWNVWNHEQAKWGSATHDWTGWSVDNPYNNYHYSFLRATMLLGLATYKEAPEGPGWVDLFRKEKLTKLIDGYNTNIVGGGSREGTGYGVSQKGLFELYDFWEASTKERVWDLTPSTRLSLAHFMHSTVPTFDRIAPIGDHARDSEAMFFDYHREQVLVLQKLLGSGDQLGDVAQTFLEAASVKQMEQFFEFVWDFLYSDPNHAKLPLAKLPNTYYGSGTGFTFFRSSWQNDATWGALIGGPFTESHAHRDQGSLLIYKNHWLAYDQNVSSSSGLEQDEDMHNLVRLVSGGETIHMRAEKNPGQTVALSDDANFVYWSGKLDALYDRPNITRVERDVVFVKPLETFVVFDRINATGVESTVWQVNSKNAAQQSGAKWTVTESGSILEVFPLLPAGATASVRPWTGGFSGGSRLDITSTSNARFLNVLAPAGRVQSATTSSAGGNSIATVTFAGGTTGTFTFSTDGTGGHVTLSGGSVNVDANLATSVQTIPVLLP
jgi:hypothetical protein